jgi:predicted nucleic acid-binding protein
VLQALPVVDAAVPTVWIHEVANGLRTAQKRQRIAEVAVMEFVGRLGPLPIHTIHLASDVMLVEVRRLALTHNLSAYDASYLAVAQKLSVPLAHSMAPSSAWDSSKLHSNAEWSFLPVSTSMHG